MKMVSRAALIVSLTAVSLACGGVVAAEEPANVDEQATAAAETKASSDTAATASADASETAAPGTDAAANESSSDESSKTEAPSQPPQL